MHAVRSAHVPDWANIVIGVNPVGANLVSQYWQAYLPSRPSGIKAPL